MADVLQLTVTYLFFWAIVFKMTPFIMRELSLHRLYRMQDSLYKYAHLDGVENSILFIELEYSIASMIVAHKNLDHDQLRAAMRRAKAYASDEVDDVDVRESVESLTQVFTQSPEHAMALHELLKIVGDLGREIHTSGQGIFGLILVIISTISRAAAGQRTTEQPQRAVRFGEAFAHELVAAA